MIVFSPKGGQGGQGLLHELIKGDGRSFFIFCSLLLLLLPCSISGRRSDKANLSQGNSLFVIKSYDDWSSPFLVFYFFSASLIDIIIIVMMKMTYTLTLLIFL